MHDKKAKVNIRKKLCQNFCPYYKPSKTEGLACKGFLVVEELLNKGEKIPFEKIGKKLNVVTEEKLGFFRKKVEITFKKRKYLDSRSKDCGNDDIFLLILSFP